MASFSDFETILRFNAQQRKLSLALTPHTHKAIVQPNIGSYFSLLFYQILCNGFVAFDLRVNKPISHCIAIPQMAEHSTF